MKLIPPCNEKWYDHFIEGVMVRARIKVLYSFFIRTSNFAVEVERKVDVLIFYVLSLKR